MCLSIRSLGCELITSILLIVKGFDLVATHKSMGKDFLLTKVIQTTSSNDEQDCAISRYSII